MESVLQNTIRERAEQTIIKENNIKSTLINILKMIVICGIVFLIIHREELIKMIG